MTDGNKLSKREHEEACNLFTRLDNVVGSYVNQTNLYADRTDLRNSFVILMAVKGLFDKVKSVMEINSDKKEGNA